MKLFYAALSVILGVTFIISTWNKHIDEVTLGEVLVFIAALGSVVLGELCLLKEKFNKDIKWGENDNKSISHESETIML